MTVLQSRINPRDPAFAENREAMQAQVDDLRQLVDRIRQGGGHRAQERHTSRGKLLPRERLNALLDPAVDRFKDAVNVNTLEACKLFCKKQKYGQPVWRAAGWGCDGWDAGVGDMVRQAERVTRPSRAGIAANLSNIS